MLYRYLLTIMYTTVIREFFVVKSFCFAQNNKKFLHENCLLVILYTVNIWCMFDMNENKLLH